ncbi:MULTISPECIES: hypothetical protein [unclassified Sphingopyxis]|nr:MULTISPECIES: hypothetical protein [unclassified Sphingopyxis]
MGFLIRAPILNAPLRRFSRRSSNPIEAMIALTIFLIAAEVLPTP